MGELLARTKGATDRRNDSHRPAGVGGDGNSSSHSREHRCRGVGGSTPQLIAFTRVNM